MVQTVLRTIAIPQSLFDMVVNTPVFQVVQVELVFHRCRRGGDSRAPTVALVEKLVWASVNTAEVSAVAVYR